MEYFVNKWNKRLFNNQREKYIVIIFKKSILFIFRRSFGHQRHPSENECTSITSNAMQDITVEEHNRRFIKLPLTRNTDSSERFYFFTSFTIFNFFIIFILYIIIIYLFMLFDINYIFIIVFIDFKAIFMFLQQHFRKNAVNHKEITEKFKMALENYSRFSFVANIEYECMVRCASAYRYQRLFIEMEVHA